MCTWYRKTADLVVLMSDIGRSSINPTLGRLVGITGYRKLGTKMSQSEPRFLMYVKAGQDGKSLGDCPFSQKANMFCRLKTSDNDMELSTVDLFNRTESFMKLSQAGKVPVLVDRQNDGKVIADSAEITKYLSDQINTPDLQQSYCGTGKTALSGVFPKLCAFMTNKDQSKDDELKSALVAELQKLDDFLKQPGREGKFLICDQLCEIDCQILPQLRHVQVAGKHYKGFEIPADLTSLHAYIRNGENEEVFKKTCAPDSEFIFGWKKHFS